MWTTHPEDDIHDYLAALRLTQRTPAPPISYWAGILFGLGIGLAGGLWLGLWLAR